MAPIVASFQWKGRTILVDEDGYMWAVGPSRITGEASMVKLIRTRIVEEFGELA